MSSGERACSTERMRSGERMASSSRVPGSRSLDSEGLSPVFLAKHYAPVQYIDMKPCRNCSKMFSRGGASRYCGECRGTSREKRAVLLAKKSEPCVDCGQSWPYYCMQFDHLPGAVKVDTVARLASGAAPLCVLLSEIAKCELVCCNCHLIRSRKRGNFVATSLRPIGPVEPTRADIKRMRSQGVVGWGDLPAQFFANRIGASLRK